MLLRNIIAYSGTSLVVQVAQLVQGFVIRRLLHPDLLGAWNYVGVTLSFIGTFDVGITSGAARELPLLRGAARRAEEELVRSTAFWARLGQAAILAIGIVLYAWWGGTRSAHAGLIAWSAAVLLLLSAASESLTTFYQSSERYVALGRASMIGSLATAACLPLGVVLGGLVGLMCAAILAAILQFLLLIWLAGREGLQVRTAFSPSWLRQLVRFGLPMRLVDYPLAIFSILD